MYFWTWGLSSASENSMLTTQFGKDVLSLCTFAFNLSKRRSFILFLPKKWSVFFVNSLLVGLRTRFRCLYPVFIFLIAQFVMFTRLFTPPTIFFQKKFRFGAFFSWFFIFFQANTNNCQISISKVHFLINICFPTQKISFRLTNNNLFVLLDCRFVFRIFLLLKNYIKLIGL